MMLKSLALTALLCTLIVLQEALVAAAEELYVPLKRLSLNPSSDLDARANGDMLDYGAAFTDKACQQGRVEIESDVLGKEIPGYQSIMTKTAGVQACASDGTYCNIKCHSVPSGKCYDISAIAGVPCVNFHNVPCSTQYPCTGGGKARRDQAQGGHDNHKHDHRRRAHQVALWTTPTDPVLPDYGVIYYEATCTGGGGKIRTDKWAVSIKGFSSISVEAEGVRACTGNETDCSTNCVKVPVGQCFDVSTIPGPACLDFHNVPCSSKFPCDHTDSDEDPDPKRVYVVEEKK